MWVYKHDLFKRDHPEGLALLRRRTSSPLDGRKQRVPRPLTKKVSLQQRDETKSDDDTTTSIEAAATLQPVALCVKKRQATTTLEANFAPNHQEIITGKKRKVTTVAKQCSEQHVAQRSAWSSPDHTVDEECVTDAIATVLQAAPLTVSEDSDDQDSSSKMHNAETEMEEQSMTVSEVATQLAQYARKATIGRRGASFRRSGIVTPPSRSSRPFSLSTGNLLTYDDESGDEGDIYKTSSQVSRQKLGIDPQSHVRARHNDPEIADPDFVISRSAADGFVERVLDSIAVHDRDGLSLATKVASFCMITFPFNNTSLRNGIRELLRSCDRLAAEFQHYRLALYPSKENVVKLEQVWEHEGSRSDADATHEFRIFAVNSMQKLLSTVYMPDFRLSEGDLATLERTANMWQKSVGMTT